MFFFLCLVALLLFHKTGVAVFVISPCLIMTIVQVYYYNNNNMI